MAGSLHHGRRFERRPYVGHDGLEHWEVAPIEGDVDVVSRSSWGELIRHCAQFGVPENVWPTLDCECAIDVPLDGVYAMQAAFRDALGRLTPAQVSSHGLLSRVAAYLARGEAVFFTD
jgi:hypothetical protein